jgi:hypothetical protein
MAKHKNVVDKECCDGECRSRHGDFVGIAVVLGGMIFAMTMAFLIFAREFLRFSVAISGGLVILGVFLGMFTLMSMKHKKD